MRKLSSEEFDAVGFITGYVKFNAAECIRLNDILTRELSPHVPFSELWMRKAKAIHDNPKGYLAGYGKGEDG